MNGGTVDTILSETQVTFDNIPAPLLFVSDTSINAIVPYGIAGRPSTRMMVLYKNQPSSVVTLSVVDAAPGILLTDTGKGAIANEDGASNSPDTPAPKGSVIVLLATGEGVTAPFGTDGKIFASDGTDLTKPVLPVAVSIGGIPAEVRYAGAAPGLVAGSIQVNAVVPEDAPSGEVPVVLTVGTFDSPAATMFVQ